MTKIVFYASQAKKSHKPKSQKTHTNHQTSKKAKRLQAHPNPQTLTKFTNTYKHAQTTQNHPKQNKKTTHKKTQKPQNPTKNPQIPPKSQTLYPLSQIFANPLFAAHQHLSRKIPRFPNHTPCQSSFLLAVCFDLPLYQRHT